MSTAIRLFEKQDWNAVSEIYNQGLLTRNATFETDVPEFDVWVKKFIPESLWVAILDHKLVGWSGLQPVSSRKVYEGVVEVTLYVDVNFCGKGIGTQLLQHLIIQSEKSGIWTLYASIFPENVASVRLHRSNGFREIGYRERIAQLDGIWRSTLLFERRSNKVGN